MNSTALRDAVLTLTAIALLLALLREAAQIIVPVLLAGFISILAYSPLQWLKERGLSTVTSVLVVTAVLGLLVLALAFMLGGTISQFNEALPAYQAKLAQLTGQATGWLRGHGVEIEDAGVLSAIDPSLIMSFTNRFVVGIGDAFAQAAVILTIVLFMLVEASGYPRKLAAMADERGGGKLQQIADIVQGINRYASVKTLVSLATGILIWLGLEWVGLDFAPLWGFIAFLLNFIPNIGSLLAAVPAVLLALLQLDMTSVLLIAGIYLIVNSLVGGIIEPMVMGQTVGLSVLTVFLSLLFWGWMFGAVGMLLSVPLTMALKYAADSNAQTRWLAVLLSPAPAAETIEQ